MPIGCRSEGISKSDPKAQTYEGKDAKGAAVKFMREWPGLTAEDIYALGTSSGAGYNNTGFTPHCAIVDPYTGDMVKGMGGGLSAKGLIDSVSEAKDKLNKTHGPSVKRSTLQKVDDAGKDIEWALEAGGPNGLARSGWTRTSVKPGDKIEVLINPMRDGTPGGSLLQVVVNGQTLKT